MRRRRLVPPLVALLVVTALASLAFAGQVRVNVGQGGMLFVPRAANVNPGDHVVWIWVQSSHSVTQGDSATGTPTPGGFDSGIIPTAGSNTAAFSQRFGSTGTTLYYCIPHLPDMAGRVIVNNTTGLAKSDFRITEVLYNGTAATDLVEVTNIGTAAGDLGRYRFAVNGVSVPISTNSIPVAAGASVIVHCVTGTNTAGNLFLSGLGNLPDSTGTLALYVPNSVTTALTAADQMIDFVKWGVTANALESIATGNGFWSASAVPTVGAPGRSIAFCGATGQYGPGQWGEVATPSFGTFGDGTQNCATPAVPTSWGRIKTLYR